jgi:transcriptional regulator with XRE-family HTH domain
MKNNPDKITSKLLDHFSEARKQQGLSHEKLANLAGIHRSTISLLESKKIIPTISTCLKISEALGISLGEVLVVLEKNNKK